MIRLKQLLREQYAENGFDLSEFDTQWKIIGLIKRNRTALNYIASQFGETIANPSYMSGAFSHVWWLTSGKVLKITSNPTEAEAAAYFRKLPKAAHIISYYDVREILMNGEDHELWAIITDGVKTLDDEQSNWWNNLADNYDFWTSYATTDDVWESYMYDNESKSKEQLKFIRGILDQRDGILRDAKKFNISTYEAHGGNVGFDSLGQFVIFDIWSNMKMTAHGVYRRMTKPIDLAKAFPTNYTTDGIDTPGDPTM